ncbi:hypothetical protein Tco_1564994, partial [Tanacetum coccineum]
MPPEDEVFPAEEQPLPVAISPTADLPGYIADSDPEEDEVDPEEDPIDYPADGGDDDDDDDESSDDDEDDDDDDDVEEDDEEEEEHPAQADFVPAPVHRVTARMDTTTPISLPTPSPPLLLPSTDYRAGVSEVTLPPQKRLCIALGPRYEVGESSSAPTARPTGGFRANYGITNTWDDMVEDMQGTPAATNDDRSLMSDLLNMLFRDRRAHARTALLMEKEDRLSREALGRSMDASDTARSEVRALRTTVLAQQTEI